MTKFFAWPSAAEQKSRIILPKKGSLWKATFIEQTVIINSFLTKLQNFRAASGRVIKILKMFFTRKAARAQNNLFFVKKRFFHVWQIAKKNLSFFVKKM